MRKQITVVGLGPGGMEQLTAQALECLQTAPRVVLRTEKHPAAEGLRRSGIAFETLDSFYDAYDDFGAMQEAMARALWAKAAEPLVFAVPDIASDGVVPCLRMHKPKQASLTLIPGVSIASVCAARLNGLLDASGGLSVRPATSLSPTQPFLQLPALITEIDNPRLAGDVKLALCAAVGDEAEVLFLPSLIATAGRPKAIQACETDRQRHYDHTAAVYVPRYGLQQRSRYGLEELADLVEVLRAPDGCPWDRVQTHASMRPRLIEEAYEAAGAIDEEDDEHLFDELGDLLFQIVFHASIGRQQQSFDLDDVTTAVCRKMIRRHPKLFPSGGEAETRDASDTWDQQKMREKGLSSPAGALSDVARALPALLRAAKVQKAAEKAGWGTADSREALARLRADFDAAAREGADPRAISGTLLFDCADYVRKMGLDPEQSLTEATDQFIARCAETENSGENG